MGRPSKLTPDQWAEIDRRMLSGEGSSALAKEFGIHPAQITRRDSQVSQKVREVAQKVVIAQTALSELPAAQQYTALSLAEKLRNISSSLAAGAELGAKNFHRLSALANTELQKIDDTKPLESGEALKGVAILTKMANDSAQSPLNLLAANKETVKRINEDGMPPEEGAVPVFNITMGA